GPADSGAGLLSLRSRHAGLLDAAEQLDSRLRSDSDYLQHESVPVVSRRLVLSAVPHGRDYRLRQGVPEVEARWAVHAHLQSIRFCALSDVGRPDRDSQYADHVGHADFDDVQQSAEYLHLYFPARD